MAMGFSTDDTCATGFGSNAMLPVVADWQGTGKTSIGVFEPNTGNWHLDNGMASGTLADPQVTFALRLVDLPATCRS
jgi:hypothetical protein